MSWVWALILFLLNRQTPVPAAWGATGGARDNPWDIANVVLQRLLLSVTSGLLGALVVSRLPRHPIGWLLCLIGLAGVSSTLLGEWWAKRCSRNRPGSGCAAKTAKRAG